MLGRVGFELSLVAVRDPHIFCWPLEILSIKNLHAQPVNRRHNSSNLMKKPTLGRLSNCQSTPYKKAQKQLSCIS